MMNRFDVLALKEHIKQELIDEISLELESKHNYVDCTIGYRYERTIKLKLGDAVISEVTLEP